MLKRLVLIGGLAILVCGLLAFAADKAAPKDWHMNGTIIEACSCPMFCQCYFNPTPADHGHHGGGGGHFCRFNMAFKVNEGHYGDVDLEGATFWIGGDLGAEFDDGKADWAVLTFDKSLSPEQRAGIGAVLGHLYPVEWDSFEVSEGTIDTWKASGSAAHATLNGGKTAEIRLKGFPGMTDGPVVIQNLPYWGAPRNDGFVLMPNEVEAWRTGDKAFEFKNSNGFMITFDIGSEDVTTS